MKHCFPGLGMPPLVSQRRTRLCPPHHWCSLGLQKEHHVSCSRDTVPQGYAPAPIVPGGLRAH